MFFNFIDTINETLDIRKQYNLITEQGRVSTSGDVTKKIDVGDAIEDEIDALAANGNSASKLRMERLAKRLGRKTEQLTALHSGNSNTN